MSIFKLGNSIDRRIFGNANDKGISVLIAIGSSLIIHLGKRPGAENKKYKKAGAISHAFVVEEFGLTLKVNLFDGYSQSKKVKIQDRRSAF